MAFDAPGWLWLLALWAVLVLVCLRAYRPKVLVPFLDLWPRDGGEPQKRRAWRPPAVPISLLLLAVLAAILGLGAPHLPSARPTISRLTLVLDRGITMLCGSRLENAAARAADALEPLLSADAQVRILDPLSRETVVGPSGLRDALRRPASAVDFRPQLRAILESADRPVVLISDMAKAPAGVVAARPAGGVNNVGIVRAAINAGECLLVLRNDSNTARAAVELRSGAQIVRHELDLPARGDVREYILKAPVNLPVKVELSIQDDLADDNVAWILPERVSAKVVIAADMPRWLGRWAESYSRTFAPSELSPTVEFRRDPGSAPRRVIIPTGGEEKSFAGITITRTHQVLQNVILPRRAVVAASPLPQGQWDVLVEADGRPILAVDEQMRRVWIGMTPAGQNATVDELILQTNSADWCAQGVARTIAPASLDVGKRVDGVAGEAQPSGLKSGLYLQDGTYTAVNASAPELREYSESVERLASELGALAQRQSRRDVGGWFWVAGVALASSAAVMISAAKKR